MQDREELPSRWDCARCLGHVSDLETFDLFFQPPDWLDPRCWLTGKREKHTGNFERLAREPSRDQVRTGPGGHGDFP